MKKIITAVAAIAMAASMFAIDFTGGVKIDGSLFDKSFADGAKVNMLHANDGMSGGNWWGTRAQTAFYGDKGSAQFAISTNWGGAVKFNAISISFNPVDSVKVQLLEAGDKLNEAYTDQKKIIDVGGAFAVTATPVDGLSIGAVLGNDWIKAGVVGDTGVKVAYTADFGTVGAMFVGKPVADKAFKNIAFGAGYAGTFDSVSCFADVALNMVDGKMTAVSFDEQVKFDADAFSFVEYAAYTLSLADPKPDYADTLLLRAKVSYALDNCTPYLEVKSNDLIADVIGMTIQPGVTFNVGCVSLGCGVNIGNNIKNGGLSMDGDAVASKTWMVSVPFEASVSF